MKKKYKLIAINIISVSMIIWASIVIYSNYFYNDASLTQMVFAETDNSTTVTANAIQTVSYAGYDVSSINSNDGNSSWTNIIYKFKDFWFPVEGDYLH